MRSLKGGGGKTVFTISFLFASQILILLTYYKATKYLIHSVLFVVIPISENCQKNKEEILVEKHQDDDHHRCHSVHCPRSHRYSNTQWFKSI